MFSIEEEEELPALKKPEVGNLTEDISPSPAFFTEQSSPWPYFPGGTSLFLQTPSLPSLYLPPALCISNAGRELS